jgi:hypothetical protein
LRTLTPLHFALLQAPSTSKLPIRAEVILAFLLGGAFLAISYQKKHYLATK